MKKGDVTDLDIPRRARTGLLVYGCRTVSDVVKAYNSGELITIRKIGVKTVEEIRKALIAFGIPEEELSSV